MCKQLKARLQFSVLSPEQEKKNTGRWRNGEREERENGGTGERGNGRTGERENGRTGERENGRTGERANKIWTLSFSPIWEPVKWRTMNVFTVTQLTMCSGWLLRETILEGFQWSGNFVLQEIGSRRALHQGWKWASLPLGPLFTIFILQCVKLLLKL